MKARQLIDLLMSECSPDDEVRLCVGPLPEQELQILSVYGPLGESEGPLWIDLEFIEAPRYED